MNLKKYLDESPLNKQGTNIASRKSLLMKIGELVDKEVGSVITKKDAKDIIKATERILDLHKG